MKLRIVSTTFLGVSFGAFTGYSIYAYKLAQKQGKPLDIYSFTEPLASQILTAEQSHRAAVVAASLPKILRQPLGLVSKDSTSFSNLQTFVLGMKFPNPLGLAAGFDKHAECVPGALDLGFGFVEVGSVTPEPQEGNPLPRVWKFKELGAVVNCYGFNSEGHEKVRERLAKLSSGLSNGVVGVNLGKNKLSEDSKAVEDYCIGIAKLGPFAHYLVVNVSSPNTPGLRSYQKKDKLAVLLSKTMEARDKLERPVPLLIKISPDLAESDKEDIAQLVMELRSESGSKIDGLVVSNTTTARPGILKEMEEKHGFSGGLSGAPLFEASTNVIRDMYRLTKGSVPIVGVGGVSTAEQALAKIKAGASLVQLYSGMAVHGPSLPSEIVRGLSALVEQQGYSNISEAVGADHRK